MGRNMQKKLQEQIYAHLLQDIVITIIITNPVILVVTHPVMEL